MVVDASVWVSAVVAADVHHDASRRWLQESLSSGLALVAPTLLLAEVACAVARRTGFSEMGVRAAQALVQSTALRLVALDADLAKDAASVGARLGLRGADAVYVAVAASFHVPFITWDEEVAKRAATLVATTKPG